MVSGTAACRCIAAKMSKQCCQCPVWVGSAEAQALQQAFNYRPALKIKSPNQTSADQEVL